MGNYIKSTILYIVYLVAATVAAMLIGSFTSLIIGIFTQEGLLRNLLSMVITSAISCVVLYIVMRRNGYKRNTTYEGNPAKELLIPLTIAILITTGITIIIGGGQLYSYLESKVSIVLIELFTDNRGVDLEYIYYNYKNHYILFLLPNLFYAILRALVMILGFVHGYKKRAKDREKIISNKN